jgi:hypothetical protein
LMTTRRLSACSPQHEPQRISHLPGDNQAEPDRFPSSMTGTTAPHAEKRFRSATRCPPCGHTTRSTRPWPYSVGY